MSVLMAALGAVAAAVGTGILVARCVRAPSVFAVAAAFAMFALGVGLGAQTLGALMGYGQLTFRAMELGAQVLAPLALCIAVSELAGRSVPPRFAARLAVSAVAV